MEKKKAAKLKEKPKQVSASSIAVATALLKHFPDEAAKILQVMAQAATSGSMQKKINRCARALDRLRQKEAPKTA